MIKRIWLVAYQDFRSYVRRPMVWVWMLIIVLLTWGLSVGAVQVISSGDSSASGIKTHVNNEFSQSNTAAAFSALIHTFFVAVLFGLAVIRDQDGRVMPILRSTRLALSEYLIAKFFGCVMILTMVFSVFLIADLIFFDLIPHPGNPEFFGEMAISNYLNPMLKFTFPNMLFIGGISFAIGAIFRKPVLVFFFPVAMLMFFLFLMGWSPIWLPNWVSDLMMWVEPTGFRWLQETYLSVDRGAEFYNEQTVTLTTPFLISRIVLGAIGLLSVMTAVPLYVRRMRGARQGRLTAVNDAPAKKATLAESSAGTLGALNMSQRRTGWISDVFTVARYELQELRRSPALYLFIPFILIEVVSSSLFNEGTFGTPLLHTSGGLAVMSMGTLTIYGCLLLMFYTVESQLRERIKRLAPIFYSTQAKTFSLLLGKTLANAGIAFLIVAASLVACLIILTIQGTVTIEFLPFVLIWGALMLPSYIVWSAFITLAVVLTRNRYATYAIGAAALIGMAYLELTGEMSWLWNWWLLDTINWSDLSVLQLDRTVMILNRLFVLALSILFVYLASKLYWRRGFDAVQLATRMKPMKILGFGLRALPFLLLPMILAPWLIARVESGYEGAGVEGEMESYRDENMATWYKIPQPAISGVDIELDIEPDEQSMEVTGTFRFVNDRDEPMDKLALTVGPHWNELGWKLQEGFARPDDWNEADAHLEMLRKKSEENTAAEEPDSTAEPDLPKIPTDEGLVDFEPRERSGLHVFDLAKDLKPGEHLTIQYSFKGKFPDGASKNGGGLTEFILPAGVVLGTFSPSFVPMSGFIDGIGVGEDEEPEAEEYDFDFYEKELRPLMGTGDQFHVRTTITGPEEFTFNGVGEKLNEDVADGRKTVVFESDRPVSFFNVVGGQWQVKKGETTEIYYSDMHPYNVDEMSEALEASRAYYSKWFTPYPWKNLRLSEFPNLASYAQGFPTNITFSEGIGFLTEPKPGMNAPFMVTAHEAAHQWWGNILVPGDGPGGNILSEGMAHFSSGLLLDQVKGEHARIEFFKQIERQYGQARTLDSERPMVAVDGSRPGDQTVTYDRGGWVFWMLLNEMGRRDNLQGIQAFIAKYSGDNKDHPVLQDFLILMREFAKDKTRYDEFVRQWFLDTVVPHYKFSDVELVQEGDGWVAKGKLTNKGRGKMTVEIAATLNERFEEAKPNPEYEEVRGNVTLGENESVDFEIRVKSFKPDKLVVDPDVKVLQLNRNRAVHEF